MWIAERTHLYPGSGNETCKSPDDTNWCTDVVIILLASLLEDGFDEALVLGAFCLHFQGKHLNTEHGRTVSSYKLSMSMHVRMRMLVCM